MTVRRVGIYGWGVVAPRSPNVESFAANLNSRESWLSPFNGYGPDNFLVGTPEFDFEAYRGWISERFPPNRFRQLAEKMGFPTQYAVGSFIQALGQNPNLEDELRQLGTQAHVYIGTGLGDLPTIHGVSRAVDRAQRRWNRFWCHPERNAALSQYLTDPAGWRSRHPDTPPDPTPLSAEAREDAEEGWESYWCAQSPELGSYLKRLSEIEGVGIQGDVEHEKGRLIRQKRSALVALKKEWGAPDPPWEHSSVNLLWNIASNPAAQVSMLGKITGMTFAPVAACSTFGYALRLAVSAIRAGEAKAVVCGATDPPPHPLFVGSFYNARVLSADGHVSKPLTDMRGTHVSGGAVVWILGDHEYMSERGLRPLGLEPVGVAVTADADHIITPSREGPTTAIQNALRDAGTSPEAIRYWDLHATATPGDYLEVETMRGILGDSVVVTARKGSFGHGMGAGGGWELLAQYLCYEKDKVFPTALRESELHPEIRNQHRNFVFDTPQPVPEGMAGKLSMGVGGINVCIISRPWK